MRGLAAELRGARLWMKVATVPTVSLLGSSSYTCSMSKMMYGDQHKMNTEICYLFSLSLYHFLVLSNK